MNYYVSLKELKELFHITCESLEYEKNFNEFQRLVKDLLNVGILRPSKKKLQGRKTSLLDSTSSSDSYFMVISPNQLKAIIDTIFQSN